MMSKPWENDSCEHVQSYYTLYPVPVAAALWCGIPPGDVGEHLQIAQLVARGVFRHPYIKCLEPRCRALHEAIEKGVLLVSRENGKSFDGSIEHVAPERRHVTRQNLKEWIAREFPSDKPEFLFDEIERQTHSAISADAFRALQADRDALKVRVEKGLEWASVILAEKKALIAERDDLLEKLNQMNVPGERSETTYLNVIAALLECIAGNLPKIQRHPSFPSEAKLIEAIDEHFRGYAGLSKSNLQRKFPEAKRTLKSQ